MTGSVVAQSLQGTDAEEWKGSMAQLLGPVVEQVLDGTHHKVTYHGCPRQVTISWRDGPRREAVEAAVQAVLGGLPLHQTLEPRRALEYGEAGQVLLVRRRSQLEVGVALVELYQEQGCPLCGHREAPGSKTLESILARSEQQSREECDRPRLERVAKLLVQMGKVPGPVEESVPLLRRRLCQLGHVEGIEELTTTLEKVGGRYQRKQLGRQPLDVPPQEQMGLG